MNAPLAGLRVVEIARVLAGPWAGQILADLGAEVVKVESPQGDDTRKWGPPFAHGREGEPLDAAYFHACNRGKRSLVADFTTKEGREAVTQLARRSDVLIENFKVGALAKYALDYASLAKINHRLIYCSVTAFGQTGPYAHRAGYDFIIQGMSGIMHLTGEPDGAPQKIGVAFADIFTGLYAAIGVLAALGVRARTGTGQHIDMSLFDSMVGVLANQGLNYLIGGKAPRRMGNTHQNIVPYQVFAVRDGHVIIAVGNDSQFERLSAYLGKPSLASDPKFSTNAARVEHRDELIPRISAQLKLLTRDELLRAMEDRGVPAGPINSVPEVFADPQLLHRDMCLRLPASWAAGGFVPSIRTPIRFSESKLELSRPSPRLGEHTSEVLSEIGSSDSGWRRRIIAAGLRWLRRLRVHIRPP
jgi:crotonobetainyl-CoA:carnitine CoA-transferase CaiB-like acyl-CoA transferase